MPVVQHPRLANWVEMATAANGIILTAVKTVQKDLQRRPMLLSVSV